MGGHFIKNTEKFPWISRLKLSFYNQIGIYLFWLIVIFYKMLGILQTGSFFERYTSSLIDKCWAAGVIALNIWGYGAILYYKYVYINAFRYTESKEGIWEPFSNIMQTSKFFDKESFGCEFYIAYKEIKQIIKYTSVFVVVYLVIGVSASLIITQTGINKQGLKNNNPEWKFVLGFNHDSCGYYNEEDTIYLSDRKKEREVIKERIMVNPIKMTQLMTCKIDNFWLQSDISVKHNMYITKKINILGMKINFMDIEKIFITFNKLLYLLTLFTCLTGVIYNRKKIIKSSAFFFIILMIVTFGVYLLIEIQPRYAYFIQVSIFILSTYGYDMLLNKVKAIYKNMKKKYKRSKKVIWIKYKV